MSYTMRWMLTVEPEPGELRDLVPLLCWLDHETAPSLRDLMSTHGAVWSWYEMETEMRDLSERFPSLRFTLDAHNVDEAGLYPPERLFFQAGKHYRSAARIVFDDFDPAKLA